MAKCIYCGTTVNDDEKYCTNCGANLEKQKDQNTNEYAGSFTETQTNQEKKNATNNSDNVNYPPYIKKELEKSTDIVSIGKYVGMLILMLIPVVNLIMAIIWSCGGSKNKNTINFGRAALIIILICAVLSAAICGISVAVFGSLTNEIFSIVDDETDGMLSQFGINSWDDIKDYSNMNEQQVFDKINSNFDGKLPDYGINSTDDLEKAFEDGSIKDVLKDFGYSEEQIEKIFDNEGVHVHVDDETGDVHVDIDNNGVNVNVNDKEEYSTSYNSENN